MRSVYTSNDWDDYWQLHMKKDSMFFVSHDHMLKVKFLGSRDVTPVEKNKSEDKDKSYGAKPLSMVTYNELWKGVTLVYEHEGGSLAKTT